MEANIMADQTLNNFLDDTLKILNTQKITSEEIVKIAVDVMENISDCKSQYKNAQKVEYKNVQFPYLSSST